MNIPIQELIDAITALTAATERNSDIAQKALDLHLSAASHLPTGIEQSVIEPAKKTRAKKAEPKTAGDFEGENDSYAEAERNAVEEIPTPEPIREPEAPGVTDPALLPKEPYPQPTEPPVTVETIRAYIGQYMLPVNTVTGELLEAAQANNAAVTAKVKEINAEFKAARIPDVPTERLAEYLTVLKRWIPLNK